MTMKDITNEQAIRLGKRFNINFKIIPFKEWKKGLEIELEHGSMYGKISNVTINNLIKTAKIAIAHLIEDPRYYYLIRMERSREKYWDKHEKPKIFIK